MSGVEGWGREGLWGAGGCNSADYTQSPSRLSGLYLHGAHASTWKAVHTHTHWQGRRPGAQGENGQDGVRLGGGWAGIKEGTCGF